MDYKQLISKEIKNHVDLDLDQIQNLISNPPNRQMGDFAFGCFKLGDANKSAKILKEKIEISMPKYLEKLEVKGPYLNFYLTYSNVAKDILPTILKEKQNYLSQKQNKKTIVIDFSSPNIAKPFGIGHLRSTVIGNSLYRIYTKLGYKVIGVNHLGDWGTQFGKLIVAYKLWGKKQELEKDPIKYLLKLYVRFHKDAETNEKLIEDAREEFKKLEDGDKQSLQLWKEFKDLSIKEFERIYQILDVKFDSLHGEAFYNDKMQPVIDEPKQNKSVPTKMSQGAFIVDLEEFKMPPILLVKSNKATTYHTRDLAAVNYRLKEYKPNKILYVVGQEQKLHFRQLFKTLELSGQEKDKFEHLDFGLFRFPEGKMSTRKGNVIFLEEVLDKAIKLALDIINEKNPDLKNKQEIAKQVGVGAIIFADLSNDRTRNINFDWNRMLSFEGETAPYIQYTHARCSSILRKLELKENQINTKVDFKALSTSQEHDLIWQIYNFKKAIVRAAKDNKPHHLAQYLISLAQTFNDFYHHCHVNIDDQKTKEARILLVESTRQIIENGLYLLGIKAPKEM